MHIWSFINLFNLFRNFKEAVERYTPMNTQHYFPMFPETQ